MDNTTRVIETKDIGIHFDGVRAVKNVNFSALEGEITAIIGPNGAGKTTLFNLIAGFYVPTEGNVFFYNENITKLKPYKRTKIGISRTFQNINLFKEMSVVDNALVGLHCRMKCDPFSSIINAPWKHREERESLEKVMNVLEFMELDIYAEKMAGSLPYGLQKNLEIARALLTEPKVVLLDEPASGLNSQDLDLLSKRIVSIRERGISVILIEHKMDVVMSISDKIMVLNFGEKIAYGTPDEIRSDPLVIEAYLGKDKSKNA